ncbi:MAG: recombinase RecQ, partial [Pseudomonadota bacterium]|nr:recombinase RecQ [Pseudomonadota bacterium]
CMGKWQPWPHNNVATAPEPTVIQGMLSEFNQAYQAMFNQLPEPETQTRFLSGMTSPWLTKVKAKKISNYAALEQVPYADVLKALKA